MAEQHATRSIWHATADLPDCPPLNSGLHADVCVVGAGISGLTTAYFLAQSGRSVIVLDRAGIGAGETGRTTAHLSNALDDRYTEIERLHGADGARLAAQSHTVAIDTIGRIVEQEHIDCGFRWVDGYLFVQEGEDPGELGRELVAAHQAGLMGVEQIERAPLPGFDTGPCLRFPRQAQCHSLRYLAGVARAVERLNGRIFSGAAVLGVEDGAPARVETADGHTVTADAVVVATNTPVNDRVAMHTKQAAYRTYAVALEVPSRAVHRALYWDTGNPYHYVRLAEGDGGEEVLIVGGEDHKTGQADDTRARFGRLEAWARARFHGTGPVRHAWSGQVLEPVDALAFIGRNPGDDHVYIATGDSGHGMTHGTIAGLLLTDMIAGRENPWASLYDPARVSLRASREFAKENLNVAAQYVSLVTPGEVGDEGAIPPGSGAVVRDGLQKVAVYRADDGSLHRFSAVCPHLGCIVDWNATEKSWDCPCHGSRFDAMGRVLNGPSVANLSGAG